ncbi:hypothetical protein [Streptomyces sp. NPDC101776]|uniref:hypothetical protein n=1 Tax=Streptomyces sp. NPDC101776 TaxID=3366146 RepID=UPI00382A69B7
MMVEAVEQRVREQHAPDPGGTRDEGGPHRDRITPYTGIGRLGAESVLRAV